MGVFSNGDGLKNIICVLEQVQPGWPASVRKCCVPLPDYGDRAQSWLFCTIGFVSDHLGPYRRTEKPSPASSIILFLKYRKALFFFLLFFFYFFFWLNE